MVKVRCSPWKCKAKFQLQKKVTERRLAMWKHKKITVSQAEPNPDNCSNLLFDNLWEGDIILLWLEYTHRDYGLIQNVIKLVCQYSTNQQNIQTQHQEMETDTSSMAYLVDTININDFVMGSDSEQMVTLMLLRIWIQICI